MILPIQHSKGKNKIKTKQNKKSLDNMAIAPPEEKELKKEN